jgi:transposase
MPNISGIDVSKHELVLYANGNYFSITNDKKSLRNWFKKNKSLVDTIDKFVYEPTGGYEKILEEFFMSNGYPGFMVHANHVRSYAKALGILAKTDQIDAKVIAEFGSLGTTRLNKPKKIHKGLSCLVIRREQLIEMKKQENSRLETLRDDYIKRSIKKHIKLLNKEIEEIENRIEEYVNADAELKAYVKLLSTIPGVGVITVASIIAYMPELESATPKELAALAGLAPMNRDSGNYRGKRKIQGGRGQIRRILYMSAVTAKRFNPDLAEFYNRLRNEKGKFYKVAITAVMRKLLILIQAVAIRGTPWQARNNDLNYELSSC